MLRCRSLEPGICLGHEFGDLRDVAAVNPAREQLLWLSVSTVYFQGKVHSVSLRKRSGQEQIYGEMP